MVNNSKKVFLSVGNEHRVYLVLMHFTLYVSNLRVGSNRLWVSCHNVAYGMIEELGLPPFHSAAYVTISN